MTSKQFPTLYKRDSKGRVQVWIVNVLGNVITTIHGLEDGKRQSDSETIAEGKNVGRSNATTPEEQAMAEAESRWKKKQGRKGYNADRAAAAAGDTGQDGFVSPMLAHRMDEYKKKAIWPGYEQPKLDGLRGLVHVEDGVCTFMSRQRKEIGQKLTKLKAEFERLFPTGVWDFDGEFFSRDIPFNDIQSAVMDRGKDANPYADQVQMWVYDLPNAGTPFYERTQRVRDIFLDQDGNQKFDNIVPVETYLCVDESVFMDRYRRRLSEGYEGAMYRNPNSMYEQGKRSYGLLKMKPLYETDRRNEVDCEIVGCHSGRGKFQGLAILECVFPSTGKEFDCAAPGTHEEKAAAMDPKVWKDCLLEITFAELTPDGKPRFPIATKIKRRE